MDIRYLEYCPPGVPFYDVPATAPSDADDFPAARADLAPGWTRTINSHWVSLVPDRVTLPAQGWKIHVSATLDNAGRVLDVVRQYCEPRDIAFKFIRGPQILRRRNGKYGDRSASGKFIALYPTGEEQLATVLTELGALLDGERGPYILSDLRWRSGPLFVRYGGFALRTVLDASGREVFCIEDPEGRLVPDVRGPGFRPPEWVEIPDCLAESLAARNAGTLDDFPFRATKALHFSNGGGVYKATDTRDGGVVLLKEARPLAGLDDADADAVTRLERERWALDRLAGLNCVPALYDYRVGREHYFLAREFVDGPALIQEVHRRNPLVNADLPETEYTAYAAWATGLLDQVEQAVEAMHGRGVVFGDLHPNNILVSADGTIRFIDFEASSAAEDECGQVIAAPGFRAPEHCTGTAVDRYALGCLRLAVFLPLTVVMTWSPAKLDQLIQLVTGRFPVPADFEDRVRRDLQAPGPARAGAPTGPGSPVWPLPTARDWPVLRADLADGILSTATPDRDDRLFPGDIEQFRTPGGGVNLATGAAGVLWALAETGTQAPPEHIDWLTRAAGRLTDPRAGLYDGLGGIAFALDRLGRPGQGRELLERALRLPRDGMGEGLSGGLSGLGLVLLHFARTTADAALLDQCLELADTLTGRSRAGKRDTAARPGLLHGGAGAALFLVRLHEETSDPTFLHQAVEAVRTDLADLGWPPGGDRSDQAPWRTPLIAFGSGGLGMVLRELLRHRDDPGLTAALDAFRAATRQRFMLHSGLYHGRAGVTLALGHLRDGTETTADALREHLAGLGWHAVPREGGPLFLGDHNLRLSTDLATGSAGVLLALDSVFGTSGSGLPFLPGRTGGPDDHAA
ncbi:class III lanthionine synthetase LanKC [Streptomyces hundungensis]|uniref:class III lanthionine synthetase LanKC n=1 Tax=Streptomyces hundungensis TaxID=1077946 RepID=UPI0031F05CB4